MGGVIGILLGSSIALSISWLTPLPASIKWWSVALGLTVSTSVGLFFGIYLQYVGYIAFIHLLVAAAATYKVTKCWIWVIGGVEYCVFWAICCLVVAMHAYHAGI